MVTDGLEEAELDFHLLARRFKKKDLLAVGVRQYVRTLPLKVDLDFPSFLSFFSTKETRASCVLCHALGTKNKGDLRCPALLVISLLIHALANWLLIGSLTRGRRNHIVKKDAKEPLGVRWS
jgi:hypothetical protein